MSSLVPDHFAKAGQRQEPTQDLEKEKWESAHIVLARNVKDDLVVGKPKFNSYFKAMKAEDKTQGFSGQHESYKTLF